MTQTIAEGLPTSFIIHFVDPFRLFSPDLGFRKTGMISVEVVGEIGKCERRQKSVILSREIGFAVSPLLYLARSVFFANRPLEQVGEKRFANRVVDQTICFEKPVEIQYMMHSKMKIFDVMISRRYAVFDYSCEGCVEFLKKRGISVEIADVALVEGVGLTIFPEQRRTLGFRYSIDFVRSNR